MGGGRMKRSDAKKYVFDQDTGKFDYIGTRYQVTGSEADFVRLKRWGMAAAVLAAALFVSGGTFTHGGMNQNYVLTPYVLLSLPTVWLLSRFIKLWNKRMVLTEAGNRLLVHIRRTAPAVSALGALAALTQLIYSLLNGWSQGDALYMLLMLLCAPLGLGAFWLARRCPTQVQVIDDLPEEEAGDE